LKHTDTSCALQIEFTLTNHFLTVHKPLNGRKPVTHTQTHTKPIPG